VDVSKYVRDSFPDQALYDSVVGDKGGESSDVLKTCALSRQTNAGLNIIMAEGVREADFDLAKLMCKSGPGLVSNFCVHKKFKKPAGEDEQIGIVRFDGQIKSVGKFIPLKGEEGVSTKQAEAASIRAVMNPHFNANSEAGSGLPTPTTLNLVSNEHTVQATIEGNLEGKKHDEKDYHARVLIGGRREGKKTWLLL
jgi:hypothetical protein